VRHGASVLQEADSPHRERLEAGRGIRRRWCRRRGRRGRGGREPARLIHPFGAVRGLTAFAVYPRIRATASAWCRSLSLVFTNKNTSLINEVFLLGALFYTERQGKGGICFLFFQIIRFYTFLRITH